MVLERKIIPFPLTSQPDAGTDPKLVQGLIKADNVHWARMGAAEKRFLGMTEYYDQVDYGFLMAPVSGDPLNADGPILVGTKNLYKEDVLTNTFTRVDKSGLADITVTPLQATSDGYYANYTYLETNNFYVATSVRWGNMDNISYKVFYSVEVFSKSTNKLVDFWYKNFGSVQFLRNNKTRMLRPVLLASGNINVYFIENSDNNIYYVVVNGTTGAVTNATNEISIANPKPVFTYSNLDACLMSDGITVHMAYVGQDGSDLRPVIITHNTTTNAVNSYVVTSNEEAWRVGIFPFLDGATDTSVLMWWDIGSSADNIDFLTFNNNATIVRSLDGFGNPLSISIIKSAGLIGTQLTGVQLSSTVFIAFTNYRKYLLLPTSGSVGDGNEEVISPSYIYTSGSDIIAWNSFAYALTPFSGQNATLISKPWITPDNQLIFMATSSGHTATLRDYDGSIIGKCLFEKYEKDGYLDGYIGQGFVTEPFYDTSIFSDGYQRTIGLIRKEGTQYTLCKAVVDLSLTRLGEDHGALIQRNATNTIYIPNSFPYQWDGLTLTEQGFLDQPRYIALHPNTGGNMAAGKYWYQMIWSWTDAQGDIHRSIPSLAYSITLTSGQSAVNVTVPTCRCTRRKGTKIEVYRTLGNNIEPKLLKTLENDEWLVGQSQSFIDILADNALIAQPTIYTFGGVIENVPPPSYWIHCIHQGRQFVVDTEHPNTHIYYSKELVASTAVEHSDSFLLKVPPGGGPINALASMMDRLIVLKQDAIYVFSGSGPDPLGSGASWSEPYTTSTVVGCTNPRSMIEVPDGVMFLSKAGIMLLSRNLQLSYIGEPVRHWTENSTISGAITRKDKSVAMWFFSGINSEIEGNETGILNGPRALIYNYKHNMWSTWSGSKLECDSVTTTIDDKIWMTDGYFMRFSTDGIFYDQDYNAGAPVHTLRQYEIPMTIETGWIPLANIGGFARLRKIYLIGHIINSDNTKLNLKIAYDYDGYYSEILEFSKSQWQPFDYSYYYGDMSNPDLDGYGCILEVAPSRQKCTAIKLKIYDSNPGFGQNWSATALAFNIGIKPSGDKGPAGKVFTK